MVRFTRDNRIESLPVSDRYFVKRMDITNYDGAMARSDLQRETEETGRPLGEILADLRVAGTL